MDEEERLRDHADLMVELEELRLHAMQIRERLAAIGRASVAIGELAQDTRAETA